MLNDRTIKTQRVHNLTKSILIFLIAMVLFFIFLNILFMEYELILYESVLLLFFSGSLILLKKRMYENIIDHLIVWLIVAAAIFMAIPTHYPTYYAWAAPCTVIAFNVLGKKNGTLPSFLVCTVLLVVFFIRFSSGADKIPHSSMTNVVFVVVLVCVISYYSENTKIEYENALLEANRKLEKLSYIDDLTQLHNRRYLHEFLCMEWERAKRENYPISIILCDVDYFKQYNDVYGHPAGDECLRQVAQAINAAVKRPADLVARYGGEEFIVMLSNTDLKGAVKVADDIHDSVGNLSMDHSASEVSDHISVSMGASCAFPAQSGDKKELIEKADDALYKAKKSGRNKTCY